MRSLAVVMSLSAAALALGACNKAGDKAGSAAAPGAAPAASVAEMPMPNRTAGLWKQTISGRGHAQTVRICLDANTDKKMALWSQGMGMEHCSKNEHHRGLDGSVTFASECDLPPSGHVSSKGVANGDFSSHYTVTIEGTIEGAAMKQMNGSSTTVIDAVREGDCPAGWKGGDMELPGVGKVNFESMQKKAEQLRGLSGKLRFEP
jgi:hypothetical protein